MRRKYLRMNETKKNSGDNRKADGANLIGTAEGAERALDLEGVSEIDQERMQTGQVDVESAIDRAAEDLANKKRTEKNASVRSDMLEHRAQGEKGGLTTANSNVQGYVRKYAALGKAIKSAEKAASKTPSKEDDAIVSGAKHNVKRAVYGSPEQDTLDGDFEDVGRRFPTIKNEPDEPDFFPGSKVLNKYD